jgi:hypothetical protein
MTVEKICTDLGILRAIYGISSTASTTCSIWVAVSLFDGRTLRKLENLGLVKYSPNEKQVCLSETGVSMCLFGPENFKTAVQYL